MNLLQNGRFICVHDLHSVGTDLFLYYDFFLQKINKITVKNIYQGIYKRDG